MNYNEIKNKILENNVHNWDETTIDIIANYFHELFFTIDFIDINDIFNRFMNSDNLKNGIIYLEDKIIDNKYDAVYSSRDKCIKIANNVMSDDYKKYLLFHELTHVSSMYGNFIGFTYSGLAYHEGLNEGATELISIFRNNKVGYINEKMGCYSINTSLCFLLSKIVGQKEFFTSYFYDEEKLKDLITKKGMQYEEIIYSLDYFLDKDFDLYINKLDNQFFDMIKLIMYNYFDSFGDINNLQVFEEKIKFISLYTKVPFSLNHAVESITYIEILIDKEKLLNLNYNEQIINEILKKYDLYDEDKFIKYKEIGENDDLIYIKQ